MADMIKARAATGANVYAIVFNAEADVWDTATFVPYATVDLASYALSMTELGVASRLYVVAMPSVSAGLYSIVAFVRAGGAPAETDTAIGSGEAHWDGDSFPLLSDIDANTLTASNNSVAAKDAVELAHQMLSLLSRSDAGAANDFTIALAKINEDGGSGAGAYDNTTDSLEALEAGGGGLDAAGVRAAVGLGAANLDTQLGTIDTVVDAVKVKTDMLPDGITKNAALANFTFFMASSTDHVTGATGLTVTATRSLDGAAFAACANAVSEIGAGWYKITLAAGDLNGDIVALLFSATGADARALTLKTET